MFKKCDRCDSDLNNTSFISWYNAQEICSSCRVEEQRRPDYPACRDAEKQAVANGNLNFHYLPAWKKSK